ncbi:nucleoside phosphorylase [Lichenihabitans psoromatis]|uniref:nucleoside phosphorylase n=1 Tax=Lichenihabitans psoromatis TaxID=2528642 RepID=UPI001035AC9D|nr:nucleoside phosphorylase [Lichenihabitans psoromatis]
MTEHRLPALNPAATALGSISPLLGHTDYDDPSVFRPENMLRECRRQRVLPAGRVPRVCILDPDADMVHLLRQMKEATQAAHWACYHTVLWQWTELKQDFGIVGGAVGGSFAVLVAEQLFASGCELLISIASAGRIATEMPPSDHILIDRALRDEGTSHHYLPPARFVAAAPGMLELADRAARALGLPLVRGATWTTDAPFRETAATIAARQAEGIVTVEMEAAGLLAFAEACDRPVVCLAHVTNEMGLAEGDFEKGANNGATASLNLALAIASAWQQAGTFSNPL